MATRQGYLVDNSDGTYTGTWENLTDTGSFTTGSKMGTPFAQLFVQAIGTFGGTTLTVQVSADGATWATAKNPQGTSITFTSAGVAIVAGNPRFIRPSLSGGSGIDVDFFVVGSHDATGANLIVQDQLTTLITSLTAYQEKCIVTASAAALVNGTTIFTVSGGPIRVMDLISYCETVCDTTASTLKWTADGDATNQSATDFTGASGSLASFAVGGIIYCNFTALNTAPVITQTAGVALWGPTTSTGGGVYIPAGVIKTTIGTGSTTGTFRHYMRYVPLSPSSSVA